MNPKPNEIVEAILKNDVDFIAKTLEEAGFTADGKFPHCFKLSTKKILTKILSTASAHESSGIFDMDLANEIITRTAAMVDIFEFLNLVTISAMARGLDTNIIPEEIRDAVGSGDFDPEIADKIEEMNYDEFEALLAYFNTGKINGYHIGYNLPIIRRIYEEDIIYTDEVFSYMACTLRETIEEQRLFNGYSGYHHAE